MKSKKNYKLLKLLNMKGSNQVKLAELLNISYPAVQYKVKGESEFKASEIAKIKKEFNLSLAEVEDIFLKVKK